MLSTRLILLCLFGFLFNWVANLGGNTRTVTITAEDVDNNIAIFLFDKIQKEDKMERTCKLGEGGYGTVFEMTKITESSLMPAPSGPKKVALKIFDTEDGECRKFVRFNEIKNLSLKYTIAMMDMRTENIKAAICD
jgi:hypothetical protein